MEICDKCGKPIELRERTVLIGYEGFYHHECGMQVCGIEEIESCDKCGKEIKSKDKTISKGEEIYHLKCAKMLRVKISI
jgi:hypothetical protein